ncbi:hypothetical protein ATANTOWER_018830 [Ataeniobius toweri]|uniref:EGF-like domain-containing protein n=1 Tax=Ataeniobius toweri TaxID=208326 RepID=A0ABU7AGV6_9TELE|nr:hypothetical protein [Ataeniobius toweri]
MEITVCVPNPCQNSGVCKPIGNAFLCSCRRGFRGLIHQQQQRIRVVDLLGPLPCNHIVPDRWGHLYLKMGPPPAGGTVRDRCKEDWAADEGGDLGGPIPRCLGWL